jgi:hypothetical protein
MAGDASTGWTTPTGIDGQLQRMWRQGTLLAARVTGAPLFPLTLRLRRPDGSDLAGHFDAVRTWIRALEEASRSTLGFGYDIVWAEINHRQLGRNRVPTGISVPTEDDALRLIGRRLDAERFRVIVEATTALFPTLAEWFARKPLVALDHADDWTRVLRVLVWFRDHPRPQLYLRQLDISGVDTKFIEARKGLLSELLDVILPAEAIDHDAIGARAFERRYGLLSKPSLVRFRVLDQRLCPGGLSDLTVPVDQFARLSLPVRRVFIAENDVNGLAFPDMPDSLVIFGLGYGVDALAEAEWLRGTALHYWGDIDTHGFAILDRLRAAFPHARSFLMDRDVLLSNRALWVEETARYDGEPSRLTDEEQSVFEDLRADRLGDRVRLEQERIPFGTVRRVLDGTDRKAGGVTEGGSAPQRQVAHRQGDQEPDGGE